jgi:hypothetical protein
MPHKKGTLPRVRNSAERALVAHRLFATDSRRRQRDFDNDEIAAPANAQAAPTELAYRNRSADALCGGQEPAPAFCTPERGAELAASLIVSTPT